MGIPGRLGQARIVRENDTAGCMGDQSGTSINLATRRGTLTEVVVEQLITRIDSGAYGKGEKLPSQQALCREFGVSRTVLREAVASLRLGGHLIARRGSGVFVSNNETRHLRFEINPDDEVRNALKILELRLAVEIAAVALAAKRRTATNLSDITAAFERFNALTDPQALAEADFAFHLAIAHATGNAHFPQFLEALGPDIIFDLGLKHGRLSDQKTRRSYLEKSGNEHGAILSAISHGNPTRARNALKRHLEEGMTRYRRLVGGDVV
jgi:GntR family transcriptional regulator, transcriptional repressor for pyruvate dehydrogenase complex